MVPSGIHAQSISIAKYADNRKAAISFTFDDGLKEQYSILFPKMKELGIKGTFCLIGSRMNQQPKNPEKQTFTWEQAKEMALNGQEMTSHGYDHKNVSKLTQDELRYEVQHNDTLIYQHTGFFPRTYFYPGNRKSDEAVAYCSKDRVGTRTFQVSLGSKRTQEWFENYLQGVIDKGEWAVTMTHGIRMGYDSFGDETRLWKIFDYALEQARSGKLWIATFHDVAAYQQERDNTTLKIKNKKNQVVVTPKMKLNKTIFQVPLTLVLDFQPVKAMQDGREIPVKYRNEKYLIQIEPSSIFFFYLEKNKPLAEKRTNFKRKYKILNEKTRKHRIVFVTLHHNRNNNNATKQSKQNQNEKKTISTSTRFHLAMPDVCSRKDKAQF